ncbi:hypothetical protein AcW1_008822 [Taiwanofungus camphoratus]|nr:hypothetical protein AcW1_008822 [Antrodia cinnamomea]
MVKYGAARPLPQCNGDLAQSCRRLGIDSCLAYDHSPKLCKSGILPYKHKSTCALSRDYLHLCRNIHSGRRPCAGTFMETRPLQVGPLSGLRIPKWTHRFLQASTDFGLASAAALAKRESWTVVQVATPIIVGVMVAACAAAVFIWYRRRNRDSARSPQAPRALRSAPSLGLVDARLRPPRRLFGLLPGKAVRPKQSGRDPAWAIDPLDDTILLHSQSSSYATTSSAPSSLGTTPLRPLRRDDLYSSRQSSSRHLHNPSSTSLLSIPRVDVPVPSFLERFVKYKDGLRKSPSYKAAHVRAKPPDTQFKIDVSDPPTRKPTLEDPSSIAVALNVQDSSMPSTSTSSAMGQVQPPPGLATPEPATGPSPGEDERSVLLISRAPGVDFTIEDSEIG